MNTLYLNSLDIIFCFRCPGCVSTAGRSWYELQLQPGHWRLLGAYHSYHSELADCRSASHWPWGRHPRWRHAQVWGVRVNRPSSDQRGCWEPGWWAQRPGQVCVLQRLQSVRFSAAVCHHAPAPCHCGHFAVSWGGLPADVAGLLLEVLHHWSLLCVWRPRQPCAHCRLSWWCAFASSIAWSVQGAMHGAEQWHQ